jgi:endonuclease/exonuclease/phosphatase (EEP) superfamily protein YafD
VYAQVQDDLKQVFFLELMDLILNLDKPMIVGGNFNIVRERGEKSTGNVNSVLMQLYW